MTYREKIIALINEIQEFSRKKDIPEEIFEEADELQNKIDASLIGYPATAEDEYIILQNWRIKFQTIKNKVE